MNTKKVWFYAKMLFSDFIAVLGGTNLKFGLENPVKMTLVVKSDFKGDFANIQVLILQQSF